MKTLSGWLMPVLISLLIAVPAHAASFTEGKEYQKLARPQPVSTTDTIEVVELFWYGCSHCYRLEPFVHKWLESKPGDVTFVRIPAVLGKGWELLAKAYFTADLLGVLDKVHGELFSTIHEKNKKIQNEKMLREFFVAQGVSGEDFDKTINSFAVTVKVNNARMMTRNYRITGVPTVIVNGKYSTSASQAGSNPNMMAVIDYLVEQERTQGSTRAAADEGK